MSSETYKRATKKHPARVDHIDGDVTLGSVLVPIGTDFLTTISQSVGFIQFETEEGEETYLNVSSIKRVTELAGQESRQQKQESKTQQQTEEKRSAETSGKAEDATSEKTAKDEKKKQQQSASQNQRRSRYSTPDQFEALETLGLSEFASRDEIQSAYRRLVKLYHPDRLRGLGVTQAKIEYAAQRLSDINNAYRLLMKVAEAA